MSLAVIPVTLELTYKVEARYRACSAPGCVGLRT